MVTKVESVPPYLYKYVGPERVDILANALIRYTPLGAFNDPFEGRPSITGIIREHEARRLLRTLLPEEGKRAYEQLPPQLRAYLPYKNFAQYVEQSANLKLPEVLKLLADMTPTIRTLFHEKFDNRVGVLSLSEVPDDLLMWSHYAMSHTGYLIGFDARHSYFDERKGPDDELRHLRRIVYRETRPRAAMGDLEGVDLFLVKSSHWNYEREWRVLRPLSDAHSIIDGQPFSIHLFRFPPECLKEVIIGARASDATKVAIKKTVRENPAVSHVQVRQALPDDDRFLLQFSDVDVSSPIR